MQKGEMGSLKGGVGAERPHKGGSEPKAEGGGTPSPALPVGGMGGMWGSDPNTDPNTDLEE